MFEAINRERAQHELAPYHLDETLGQVARDHAQDMVSRGYLDHVTPEGKTYRERLEQRGLEPYWAGENYYYGFFPADEVVEAALAWFMGDPPHRNNILHEHCTRIGIGIVEDRQGAYMLVLDFAGE
jgi:uncharacterized protein YkwD